ncbi:MAG: chromate resistance protein ChrB domain-containing protein [Rhodoferax sp.]
MNKWITLVTSLPTENATLRQRAWRTLKNSGAAVLRDGVYLLPERKPQRDLLHTLAQEIVAAGGTALVLPVQEPADAGFAQRFDRSADYAALQEDIAATLAGLPDTEQSQTLKNTRRLRKAWQALGETDFFPGPAQSRCETALRALERACAQRQSAGEPLPHSASMAPLERADYQNRLWATRARPWVDRLACAWLIQRHIDPNARFLWLSDGRQCPNDALGFDFDGATFSHVGEWVSFEVLCERFALRHPALEPLRTLVHALDMGGTIPPEAAGVERVLQGLHRQYPDDDRLLAASHTVFDALSAAYASTGNPTTAA